MDSQQLKRAFRYKSCTIDKSRSLGRGSYGAVYKATCDELPCAAKILHPTIVPSHSQDPGGGRRVMERFEKECAFLSNMRHPHIVQCLGVSWDPDSHLPALLMELLDESLTTMLERSLCPLAFRVQVDICHDIALALAYLHSNDIIHRDLSSNNVLVIAGRRAKVTDFGMVKLAGSATPVLTQTPGTLVYMPPEALQETPNYSMKLDCFSEGVIIIQVCTRQFPQPGPRTQSEPSLKSPTGSIEVPILETERRKNHIDLVDPTNPLLPIATECLNHNEDQRPSASELCQQMAILKREISSSPMPMDIGDTDRVKQPDEKDQLIQQQKKLLAEQDHQLHELHQQLEKQEEMIQDLQERNEKLQRIISKPSLLDTSITLNWREVDTPFAPFKMIRGAAVVDEDIAYFMNTSGDVCSYNSKTQTWCTLPGCPLFGSSLAVVNDLLTAVGGEELNGNRPSNKLISLVNEDNDSKWVTQEQFHPMPTPRSFAAVVCTRNNLIVAGGKKGRRHGQTYLSTVEIMDTESGIWSTAARLPYPYSRMSVTICRGRIYMLGGFGLTGRVRSVVSCSVDTLLQSQLWSNWIKNRIFLRPVWQQDAKVPAYHFATCITINDQLYALGGCSSRDKNICTRNVQKFNEDVNTWEPVCEMPRSVHCCLAVVLPTNDLIVVGGGVLDFDQGSNNVSIANVSHTAT